MKIFVVLLLFVSATAAFNEWIGLPEGTFQQLDQLLDFLCFLCSLSQFVIDILLVSRS